MSEETATLQKNVSDLKSLIAKLNRKLTLASKKTLSITDALNVIAGTADDLSKIGGTIDIIEANSKILFEFKTVLTPKDSDVRRLITQIESLSDFVENLI